MVGERFDSGGVLSRARPVLTFATIVPGEGPPPASLSAAEHVPVALSWSHPELPPRNALPVLPRIVRRSRLEQLFEPFERATSLARRGAAMILFGALGLGTLGAIAWLGLRPPTDEASTPALTAAGRTFDAVATERLLARGSVPVRVERTIPPAPSVTPAAAPPVPAPRVAAVAAHPTPAPAHANSGTARATRKHTPSSIVARR
jgi:hypothetical protein